MAEPIEFGGIEFAKGDLIVALIGAANRDPDVFPDPDRMDVTRERLRPLSFGGGIHFCIGAQLVMDRGRGGVFHVSPEHARSAVIGGCRATMAGESLRGLTTLPVT